MITTTRRTLLGGLGSGMLAAGFGTTLGGRSALAMVLGGDEGALSFGELEPLVALMQETPPAKLQRLLVERLQGGADLRTLVAAGALANARTFGGHDYVGYHCQMALMPAYELSKSLPVACRPLPVLKVLYRNANRMQEQGGRSSEALRALPRAAAMSRDESARTLRASFEKRDLEGAELALSELSRVSPLEAFNDLQLILQENLDVHRVVLAWRAFEVMQLTGDEHARTLLRQSLRFCIDAEADRLRRGRPEPPLRALLPDLIERHQLLAKASGTRTATDDEVEELSLTVFRGDRAEAAEAVAAALASGLSHADAGEALSLAANALLLHDPGRQRASGDEKPRGSVHGASTGVHASDAARAWRNISAVSNARNAVASLIAGAYHTAGQSQYVGKDPFAFKQHLHDVRTRKADELLSATRAAIEAGNQSLAMAFAHCYGQYVTDERPMFDLLLEYALSEDGALHAEKYYRTVSEEFAAARPAFRWRHVVALARVTASQHGFPAPGYTEAREQLGV